jgi:hypothetical protein
VEEDREKLFPESSRAIRKDLDDDMRE